MDIQKRNLNQDSGVYKFKTYIMNINAFNVTELQKEELRTIDGGWYALAISAAVAIGGAMAWGFQKGEELGKALA